MAKDMFEVDPKMNNGPNQYSDTLEETGGVMPMDSTTREVVDEVASDYDVDVEYDEGVAHLYGEGEEIEDFVAEVESVEKTVKQHDHPDVSITPDADISVASYLEPSSNENVVTDGGRISERQFTSEGTDYEAISAAAGFAEEVRVYEENGSVIVEGNKRSVDRFVSANRPYFGADNLEGRPLTDGGVAVTSADKAGSDYEVDDPTDQFWWGKVSGENDIGVVRDVFDAAGVKPVHGRQEELIPQSEAFSVDEIEAIEEAVEEDYDGTVSQFVDEVRVSDVHPQQSMQIERAVENEISTPTDFSDYDGFPSAK